LVALLITAWCVGWLANRWLQQERQFGRAARWLRHGPHVSYDEKSRTFVQIGLTNAETMSLPAHFRESDWTFLLHEGMRLDTDWEPATGWRGHILRTWPISRLYRPYGGLDRRRQLLWRAWLSATNLPKSVRLFALEESIRAGNSHPRKEISLQLFSRPDSTAPIRPAMRSALKAMATNPDVRQRQELMAYLSHPDPDSDPEVIRELLMYLSVDLDPQIAAAAASRLLPPGTRRDSAPQKPLPEAPKWPTSLLPPR
jgi:hypothetical protein